MDKRTAAYTLEQIASFMELKGENTFRVRAFVTAARVLRGLSTDLEEGLKDGSLAAARGVGPATLQIVSELVNTGRSSLLEELREQIPAGLVEMLSVSGLSVAKIRQIHDTLGIDSIPELEAAARDGRLAALPVLVPRRRKTCSRASPFSARPVASGYLTMPWRKPTPFEPTWSASPASAVSSSRAKSGGGSKWFATSSWCWWRQ